MVAGGPATNRTVVVTTAAPAEALTFAIPITEAAVKVAVATPFASVNASSSIVPSEVVNSTV